MLTLWIIFAKPLPVSSIIAKTGMDLVQKKVFRGENYVHLGPTEYRLLKILIENPQKVFSREFLLKTVWGNHIYVESRTIDVHIRRLRRALNVFGPDYIRTVRATGYSIDKKEISDSLNQTEE